MLRLAPREVGACELGAGELRVVEIRAAQVGAGEVGAGEIAALEVGAGEIAFRAGAAAMAEEIIARIGAGDADRERGGEKCPAAAPATTPDAVLHR